MDFDSDRVTYSNLNLVPAERREGNENEGSEVRRSTVMKRLREFIRNYRVGNNFKYREKLVPVPPVIPGTNFGQYEKG